MSTKSMTALCELWRELTHTPSPSVITRARSVQTTLLEHVEACPQCDELDPLNHAGVAAAYDVFAGMDLEAMNDEDAFRLDASVAADVKNAIRHLLLPQLPPRLAAQMAWKEVDLYSGLDAIAMLAERESRDRIPRTILLSSQRGLLAGDQRVVHAEVVKEIRIMTGADEANAARMLDWLIEAARSLPPLFPGIIASPSGATDVLLQVQPSLQVDVDLSVQWAPTRESGIRDIPGAREPSSHPQSAGGGSPQNP